MDYASARRNMVENQLRTNRIEDPQLIQAMLEVPRERFVPKALRGVAYLDEDIVFPSGQHLIEPLVLARLIQTAEVGPNDVVLAIGCSTGYSAAVLGRLSATTITLVADDAAARQLESVLDGLGADNVVVRVSDQPLDGAPDQAPFDVIILTGAVDRVPENLLEQLGEGGRLVAVLDDGRIGKGTKFSRINGTIGRRIVFDARIPPLTGARRSADFHF